MSNGLFGPATDVLCALVKAAERALTSGSPHPCEMDLTIKGRDLRPILAQLTRIAPPYRYHDRSGNRRLREY